jgi:hypothetical protein
MGRLTDRKTAAALKENCEKLQAAGFAVDMSNLRYIKLAEYEDEEEMRERLEWLRENPVMNRPLDQERLKDKVKYEKPIIYVCDPIKNIKCKKTACFKNGGECRFTQYKEYAMTDENGKSIEYEER